eukprot:CAMPEP_0185260332 /NCGR_PEP_ID=MMETSP1359-20130426/8939_1 /TAXON_ID=552665 /ORGANISM="Bigelowiella longifila, Strain CCMP242" /LENGTH=332 /DNA_ID=CAMNT_0027846547 /DNA_START=120 /DNA_END=1115 /DNA_ORIENTATION=+
MSLALILVLERPRVSTSSSSSSVSPSGHELIVQVEADSDSERSSQLKDIVRKQQERIKQLEDDLLAKSTARINLELKPSASDAHQQQQQMEHPNTRALLLIPGFGCNKTETFNITLRNLKNIMQNTTSTTVDCLLGSYVARDLYLKEEFTRKLITEIEKMCYVTYAPGTQYADWERFVHPMLLEKAAYTHVMLLADDVELLKFNLDQAVQTMQRWDMDVISPSVHGSVHPTTRYNKKNDPASMLNVTMIEAFTMVFNVRAWQCWWQVSDHIYLSRGWGSDLIFREYCLKKYPDITLGVLPGMEAKHYGHCSGSVGNVKLRPNNRHKRSNIQW